MYFQTFLFYLEIGNRGRYQLQFLKRRETCGVQKSIIVVLLVIRREHTTPCFDQMLANLLRNHLDI